MADPPGGVSNFQMIGYKGTMKKCTSPTRCIFETLINSWAGYRNLLFQLEVTTYDFPPIGLPTA
jgi:hypothetical protein